MADSERRLDIPRTHHSVEDFRSQLAFIASS
jgi:hypothetical protein